MPAPYPDKQRSARKTLVRLFTNPLAARVIHYSCESFDNRATGQSPRVTSIAVRRLDSGQTKSFSIHAIAEERQIPLLEIDAHYNALEKEMLERFYDYVGQSVDASYLHWNMRDANYGFSALQHRLRVLKGKPKDIPEAQRFDLARMLQDMYGNEYIANPKLQKLAEKNNITMLGFLPGAEEAERFTHKDYVALHQSTLRKVDIMSDIAERAYRKTLKTDSNWWVQRGGTVAEVLGWIIENPRVSFAVGAGGLIIGVVGLVVGLHH